jgi:hypothetical protein
MTHRSPFVGRFGQSGTPGLEVFARDGVLWLRLPGAPDDTAGALREVEPDVFAVEVGPLRGMRLHYRASAGERTALEVAGIGRLPRHPDPDPPDYVVGPTMAPDPEAERAFASAYAAAGWGGRIEAPPERPRFELLAWLARRDDVVLHGSNEPAIEEFVPRRRTLSPVARQNEGGVSACSDALWAMAFAIVDRANVRGGFHNGVVPLATATGTLRLYHFSLGRQSLAARPFRRGAVYVLPRDRFRRVAPVGPASLEWVSGERVRPPARLEVEPDDFPLLDAVRGHDDTHALRYLELRDRLLGECAEARPLEDGYALRFAARPGLESDVAEFTTLQRRGFPWTRAEVEAAPDGGLALRLRGATGLRDALGDALERIRRPAR